MAHWLGLTRYEAERVGLLSSLKRRAEIVAESLDALEGVTCRMSDGALYAFPAIDLPVKFLEEATAAGEAADGLFCMRLLDATGVVVVPGSGFGQKEVKATRIWWPFWLQSLCLLYYTVRTACLNDVVKLSHLHSALGE